MATAPTKEVTKRPSAVANGFKNSIGTAVLALGGTLSSIIVVRSLSINEYGRLSFYLWLASVVSSVGLLAFPSALTKVVSQLYGSGEDSDAEALIPWVGRILFLLNVVIALVVVGFALAGPPANRPLLLIVSASLLPGAMSRVLNSRVLAREQYSISMIASIITSVVTFSGIVVAHMLNARATGYEAILLSGGLLQMVVLLVATKGSSVFRHGRARSTLLARRAYILYLVPSTFLAIFDLVVWQRSEIYFLGRLAPYAEVAFYSISYTLFSIFYLLGAALLNGLFPSSSHDFGAGNMDLLVQKSRTGLTLAGFYALPITFGGIAVAPTVLSLLYGQQMAPADPVAKVLMVGVVPGVLAIAMTMSLNAGGQVWKVVRIGAVFSVINLVLDLIFIPHGYAMGAAVANTVTQAGYALSVIFECTTTFRFSPPWYWLGLCTVMSLIFPFGVPTALAYGGVHGIALLLGMVVGYAIYLAVCWRSGIWRALQV